MMDDQFANQPLDYASGVPTSQDVKLTPIQHDPFVLINDTSAPATGPDDHTSVQAAPDAPPSKVKLTPVDHDPFAAPDAQQFDQNGNPMGYVPPSFEETAHDTNNPMSQRIAAAIPLALQQEASNILDMPRQAIGLGNQVQAEAHGSSPGSTDQPIQPAAPSSDSVAQSTNLAAGLIAPGMQFAEPGALGAMGGAMAHSAPAHLAGDTLDAVPTQLQPLQQHIMANANLVGAADGVERHELVLPHDYTPPDDYTQDYLQQHGISYTGQAADGSHSFKFYRQMQPTVTPEVQALADQYKVSPNTAQVFQDHLAKAGMPHDQFLDTMFGPGNNHELTTSYNGELNMQSGIRDKDGNYVGLIQRSIDPKTNTASHDFFEVHPDQQGAGIAKDMLRRQIPLYQKMGLDAVTTHANIDVGGYAWARYGFVPTQHAWSNMRANIGFELDSVKRQLALDHLEHTQNTLKDTNPAAIRRLSDDTTSIISPEGAPTTLGKQLLLGSSWHGKLDLKDPATMERFNAYVK